jgi:hypothetical protein
VRVFIQVPENGFGQLIGSGPDTLNAWLDREVGRTEYAWHSGSAFATNVGRRDVSAFYFRHPEPAARFLAAFPELELADGTASRGYTSPSLPFGRSAG